MIGKILKQIRLERGLSQSELARRVGTAVSNIHNIESGASKNPGWYTVLKIAKELNADINQIIE